MHRHCGTNNTAPWWTFMGPCKPEVRPGARKESASPAWLANSDYLYLVILNFNVLIQSTPILQWLLNKKERYIKFSLKSHNLMVWKVLVPELQGSAKKPVNNTSYI